MKSIIGGKIQKDGVTGIFPAPDVTDTMKSVTW
jgi:hypothetical protein